MKLNTQSIKRLFLDHGEKMALALVVVVVLYGFASADLVPYSGRPGEITTKVQEGKARLQHEMPQEELDQYTLTDQNDPRQIVKRNINTSFSIVEYQFSKPKFVIDPLQSKDPRKEPQWDRLEDPLAESGRVLLAVADPATQATSLADADADKPKKDEKPEEEVPSQFRQRMSGGFGGGMSAAGMASSYGKAPAGYPNSAGSSAINDPNYGKSPLAYGRSGGPKRGKSGRKSARGSDALLGGNAPGGDESESGYPGMGGMAGFGPSQEGRGFNFVAVRAVFPVRHQIGRLAEAMSVPVGQAAIQFEILDFEIERQVMKFSGDPWDGPWEPVDINISRDVLEKLSVGTEPDVVAGQVTDTAITMPLPLRLMGLWGEEATHPRIAEFKLSEEQIQQEAEFNAKLIEKLLQEQKDLPPPPKAKGGWTASTYDVKSLRSAALGGSGNPYADMMSGPRGGMSSRMGSGMTPGGHAGGGGGGGAPGGSHGGGSNTMARSMAMASRMGSGAGGPMGGNSGYGSPQTSEKLSELFKLEDDDKRRDMLKKYVSEMVTVDGELLLFRYLDFGVEPGRTYRYRVRLTFRNPNFDTPAALAVDPTVVAGETRKSEWSEPTEPVDVAGEQQYFVFEIKESPSRSYATPRLNVFQWDSNLGTTQQSNLDIPLGQTISGKERTKVLDPAKNSFEDKNYTFQSTDFVVDALPDVYIDSAAHPDIAPLGGASRGNLKLNEEVLVATVNGDLKVIDPGKDAAAEKTAEQNLKYQNKAFENLLDVPEATGSGGDLLGGPPSGSGSAMMMMMMNSGRGLNPLGKGGAGRRGSRPRP